MENLEELERIKTRLNYLTENNRKLIISMPIDLKDKINTELLKIFEGNENIHINYTMVIHDKIIIHLIDTNNIHDPNKTCKHNIDGMTFSMPKVYNNMWQPPVLPTWNWDASNYVSHEFTKNGELINGNDKNKS